MKNKAAQIKERVDKILSTKEAELQKALAMVNDLTNEIEVAKKQPKSEGLMLRFPEAIRMDAPEQLVKSMDKIKDGLNGHIKALKAVLGEIQKGNEKEMPTFPTEIKITNLSDIKMPENFTIENFPEVQKVLIVNPEETKQPEWLPDFAVGAFTVLTEILSSVSSKMVEALTKITWKVKMDQPAITGVVLMNPKNGKPIPVEALGGGHGSSSVGSALSLKDKENLQAIADNTANPPTPPAPVGAATEAKQDSEIAEIQNVANELLLTRDTLQAEISNKDIMTTLKNLIQAITYPAWLDRSANAIRNQVQSGTITTVTTVTTVTGITNLDGYQAKLQVINQNNGAWAQVVRARIS